MMNIITKDDSTNYTSQQQKQRNQQQQHMNSNNNNNNNDDTSNTTNTTNNYNNTILKSISNLINAIGAPTSTLPLACRIIESKIGSNNNNITTMSSSSLQTSDRIFYQIEKLLKRYQYLNDKELHEKKIVTYKLYNRLQRHCNNSGEKEMALNILILLKNLIVNNRRRGDTNNLAVSTMVSENHTHPIFDKSIIIPEEGRQKTTKQNNNEVHQQQPKQKANNNNLSIESNEQQQHQQQKYEHEMLLRECIFSLQGINGDYLSISTNTIEKDLGIKIRSGSLSLVVPTISQQRQYHDAIKICGECGFMYTCLQSYIDTVHNNKILGVSSSSSSSSSSISRALASALSKELIEYLQLVSILESSLSNNQNNIGGDEGLTLSRLMLWLYQPHRRLKIMTSVIQGVCDYQGGLLLDTLYLHTLHGDERHVQLVQRLLSKASIPFYKILHEWITEGSCHHNNAASTGNNDNEDFFIVEHYNTKSITKNSHEIWLDKFTIYEDSIPRFISYALAYDILTAGKAIHFIRTCLDDKEWRIPQSLQLQQQSQNNTTSISSSVSELGFYYGNESKIHTTIQSYAQSMHNHILMTLETKYFLKDHLLGLKQILLLNQGDFVSMLLQMSYEELSKKASKVYVHNLIGIVDSALQSSNARYLPAYVLDKIRVLLMKKDILPDFSPDDDDSTTQTQNLSLVHQEEETGYHIFSLDYAISNTPLSAIVHAHAIKQYRKIFHFIWKLKHLEFILNLSWKESKSVQYSLWKEERYKSPRFFLYSSRNSSTGASGSGNKTTSSTSESTTTKQNKSSSSSPRAVESLLRKMDIMRQEMLLFTTNMQGYLMFEVIENGWKKMILKIELAKTLDDLILAHDTFLNETLTKSLLEEEDENLQYQQKQKQYQDYSNNRESPKKHSSTSTTTSSSKVARPVITLSSQLIAILNVANRFCTLQTQIFKSLQKSLTDSYERRKEAERRLSKGNWGYDNTMEEQEIQWNYHPVIQKNVLSHVDSIAHEFHVGIKKLLDMLNDSMNTVIVVAPKQRKENNGGSSSNTLMEREVVYKDSDNFDALRFLMFRLDFSGYYYKSSV